MRSITRATVAGLACAVAIPVAASAAAAPDRSSARAPVIEIKARGFGMVLATRSRQALYYWNVEKRDFKVHCTGGCARAWPPLIVKSRSAVPTRIRGIRGRFGVIRRPDGRLQVTHNRLPIYTYAHEGPGVVRCNDVNGWFVVRT
jgi:predicted lipoprotein with Yx(FWY)xxD motif